MHAIFEIKDKTGRKIRLTKEQWGHIKQFHFNITVEDIESTLTKPTAIMSSDRDPEAKWYYRYNKNYKNYLMVSVKYLNGEGFVITAHHVDKIK